jgi:hypothetical protein
MYVSNFNIRKIIFHMQEHMLLRALLYIRNVKSLLSSLSKCHFQGSNISLGLDANQHQS